MGQNKEFIHDLYLQNGNQCYGTQKEINPNILDTMFDHIESNPPDKSCHEWAQSTVEAEHIIKYLTVENQIILDSMFGSGTTGIAALKLNRKFIGIEID